jgi:capsular polysaccharide biosynthesis protein
MLPNREISGQNSVCLHNIDSLPYATAPRYFYFGNFMYHYGHFITSSMSRVWALSECDLASVPLLGHAEGGPTDWFTWPYVPPLLGAAGLQCQDFARFETPVRLRELIVAHPSIVERNLVHNVFGTTMSKIGDRLTKARNPLPYRDTIYISKSRYTSNPSGISNENAIVEHLERYGIPIVYPETLSLPEQIQLFRSTRCIMGQCGSAFHTAIFSRLTEFQLLINIVDKPMSYSSNHHLYDAVNGSRSIYVYFPGEWHPRENANPGLRILDPQQAAENLLELARR